MSAVRPENARVIWPIAGGPRNDESALGNAYGGGGAVASDEDSAADGFATAEGTTRPPSVRAQRSLQSQQEQRDEDSRHGNPNNQEHHTEVAGLVAEVFFFLDRLRGSLNAGGAGVPGRMALAPRAPGEHG